MRKQKERKKLEEDGGEKKLLSLFLTCRQMLARGAPFLPALYPEPLKETKPPPPEAAAAAATAEG